MQNQNLLLIALVFGVFVLVLLYLNEEQQDRELEMRLHQTKLMKLQEKEKSQEVQPSQQEIVKVVEKPVVPPRDLVSDYDHRKIISPLEDPVRRVPRHWIPPAHIKRQIDIPTRGYPDTFHQIGLLTKQGDSDNKENKVLRLMGRETYPGSSKYEYFTRITDGNETINIPIENKHNKEYYDDDVIAVDTLGSDYKVKIFDYDAPKYYPDLL